MKPIIVNFALICSLAGCSSGSGSAAAPNFFNGRYYMAGDSSCTQIRPLSDGRVMCTNDAGDETGYRDAMNDQQLQMWQSDQQLAQQRSAQASAERAAFAQEMQRTSAAIQQSSPQYTFQPPQITPLNLPHTNVMSCISVSGGFYTNCRF